MRSKNVLAVFGTRPEAIKMAPVVKRLKRSALVDVSVCVTAQHRGMLDQVLNLFDIQPDFDLDLMKPNQSLSGLTSSVLSGVTDIIREARPDLLLVHGDTTTMFGAALAGFYEKIPVGHVEAGLRSGNIHSPWPEEMNRRTAAQLASLHFAPTATARTNLQSEGVPRHAVWVTGNTVIDALLEVSSRADVAALGESGLFERMPWLADESRRVILVTGHRRENFGPGMEGICNALRRLAAENDVQIIYPVHPNPNVLAPTQNLLGTIPNIHLIAPLDYLPFVALMKRATFLLTDSGGIQEEAPALGKPVLVLRDTTERPEAVAAGTVRMVGTLEETIVNEAQRLLDDPAWYATMAAAHNPYGDGQAAERIAQVIEGQQSIHEFG